MFLLICKLYICIQNVFGHIFYRSRLHLYWQFWQFEVQKLAYMLILAAGGMIPYLSSVGGGGNGYRDTEISLTQLSTNYMVLISSLIWVGVGGSSPQIISSTIFCVDELPNVQRFLPHDFELNIL